MTYCASKLVKITFSCRRAEDIGFGGFIACRGVNTLANSFFSHAEGQGTSTNNLEGVHIMGQFGAANELTYSWYLANGTSSEDQGLAAKILSNGNVKIDGR